MRKLYRKIEIEEGGLFSYLVFRVFGYFKKCWELKRLNVSVFITVCGQIVVLRVFPSFNGKFYPV